MKRDNKDEKYHLEYTVFIVHKYPEPLPIGQLNVFTLLNSGMTM